MRARAKRLTRHLLGRSWSAGWLLRTLAAMAGAPAATGLPRLALRLEIAATKRLNLFDRAYYLDQCAAPHPAIALRDYVLQGEAAGRRPSPLIDPQHYRSQIDARVPGRRLNTLLHYGLWGRFRAISPSPWFDVGYYLRSNGDVAAAGVDPLKHFARYGWREGRNPLPGLDLRLVLRDQPGLRVSKTNPLVHLLQELGRSRLQQIPDAAARANGDARNAPLLDVAIWAGKTARSGADAPRVDVIMPVYSGTGETLRCLWSVLDAPVATPFELVVIDDAGPDPVLSALLDELATQGLFTLRRNAANQGFVATVNTGLRLHPQREVVILNADTEVHNDWLDRLLAMAAGNAKLASITPLSNNATICSYPEPLHDNWLRLEIDDAELDRLAARVNAGRLAEAPTGVGFCMFMRRACLDAIGLLDEKNFGRGYGEENDWCQRALKAGWVNAIAADVFVRHHGGISFGDETAARGAAALRTMDRLHPTYQAQVRAHIAADPLWEARARLDLARLAQHRRERNALLVCHDRGGGTERHLMEQASSLQARGWGVFEMRPSKRPGAVSLNHPRLIGLHAATAIPVGQREFFVDALRTLGITSIELHQTVDFPDTVPELLLETRDTLGIELHATLHDYRAICPRINLARPDGRYCGEPDAAGCNACLATDGLRATSGDIASWRRQQLGLLARADAVRVPDEDVALRLKRYLPGVAPQVRPHDQELSVVAPRRAPEREAGKPARVMVLGAIGLVKGFDVVLQAARAARRLSLPVEFSLLGYSMNDARLTEAGVHLLGRYDDAEVLALIADNDPDLVFLPSTCPETYCYTLSAALRSGRPVVVFDIGAQARRVRSLAPPPSRVLPLALIDHPERLVRRLLTITDHPMARDHARAGAQHMQPQPPTLH